MRTVHVVSKSHGEWEGSTIYAICLSEKQAGQAKDRLLKMDIHKKSHFELSEISLDVVYPYGILANETKGHRFRFETGSKRVRVYRRSLHARGGTQFG